LRPLWKRVLRGIAVPTFVAITIPIPIVATMIDELAGTDYFDRLLASIRGLDRSDAA